MPALRRAKWGLRLKKNPHALERDAKEFQKELQAYTSLPDQDESTVSSSKQPGTED